VISPRWVEGKIEEKRAAAIRLHEAIMTEEAAVLFVDELIRQAMNRLKAEVDPDHEREKDTTITLTVLDRGHAPPRACMHMGSYAGAS